MPMPDAAPAPPGLLRRAAVSGAALLLLGLAVVGGISASASSASARPRQGPDTKPRPRRVLILSVPALSWTRLLNAQAPGLRSLFDHGAVANLSVRSVGPRTSPSEGYLSLGAGNRAGAGGAAPQAYGPKESVQGLTAAQFYRLTTARTAHGAVLVPSIGPVKSSNDKLLYGARPGLLGKTLGDLGWHRTVIGNADETLPDQPVGSATGTRGPTETQDESPPPAESPSSQASTQGIERSVALALMGQQGQIPSGSVTPALLRKDHHFADGLRLDTKTVMRIFDRNWRDRSAMLLELSDAARADSMTNLAGVGRTNILYEKALAADDVIVRKVLDRVDFSRDLVVVVSPVAPRAVEQLTPFAIRGPGFSPGVAESGATRRAGYVTLTDVAPTIVSSLGQSIPEHMSGTEISVSEHRDPAGALDGLSDANDLALFHQKVLGLLNSLWSSIVFGFAIAAMVLLAMAKWWAEAFERVSWLVSLVRVLLLAVVVCPIIAFLAGLFPYDSLGTTGFMAMALLGSLAVGFGLEALCRRVRRRWPNTGGLLGTVTLAGVLLVVLLVDIATGARMQIDTVFGYSPIGAGRFAGYGNQAYSFLAASAVVLACGVWAMARRGRRPVTARSGGRFAWRHDRQVLALLILVAVVFVVIILADGLPSLGSDVGGALTTLPTAALVLLLLAGYRITWKRVLVVAGATLALLVIFAAIDLSRPADHRTHLGRFAAALFSSGDSMGTITIQRKVHSNLSMLKGAWLAPGLGVIVTLIIIVLLRAPKDVERDTPGFRASLFGIVTVGFLAMVLNDSGITMPATMAGIYLPFVLYLLLFREQQREVVMAAAGGAAAGDGTGAASDRPPDGPVARTQSESAPARQ